MMRNATNESAPGQGGENRTLRRHHTQPAYAKQLAEARARGLKLRTSLIVSLGWDLGCAWPRIVVTDDLEVLQADFSCVAGLAVIVAHRGKIPRALAISAACLRAGATLAPIIDVDGGASFYTADTLEILGVRRAA